MIDLKVVTVIEFSFCNSILTNVVKKLQILLLLKHI